MVLERLLLHPATRDPDVDDPRTTLRRREIICRRKFLRQVYGEWDRRLLATLSPGDGPVVELGSGAGFLAEVLSGAVTSEVLPVSGARALMDGCALPFADGRLRAILMTNVLHHLPSVELFLREAERSLRPGGVVAAVEPWLTPWSRYVYAHTDTTSPPTRTHVRGSCRRLIRCPLPTRRYRGSCSSKTALRSKPSSRCCASGRSSR